MKMPLIKLTLLLTLTLSLNAFAYDKWNDGGCGSGDCDTSYCNDCQCTDPGYGRNPCISNSRYCEEFGNVGGR